MKNYIVGHHEVSCSIENVLEVVHRCVRRTVKLEVVINHDLQTLQNVAVVQSRKIGLQAKKRKRKVKRNESILQVVAAVLVRVMRRS